MESNMYLALCSGIFILAVDKYFTLKFAIASS